MPGAVCAAEAFACDDAVPVSEWCGAAAPCSAPIIHTSAFTWTHSGSPPMCIIASRSRKRTQGLQ